jgi:hypothetical protein
MGSGVLLRELMRERERERESGEIWSRRCHVNAPRVFRYMLYFKSGVWSFVSMIFFCPRVIIFGAGRLKQLTLKILIFGVSCLRWSTQKNRLYFLYRIS